MRRDWEPEDLVASWTLVDGDWRLIANKSGATRLGFALLLKFFELEACFPRDVDELPAAAVAYIAAQVKVEPDQITKYTWSGRTIEYHRAQIRKGLGFGEATRGDEEALTTWLTDEVAPHEVSEERLRGLIPLFWTHVNPYGQFNLQMDRHLDLGLPQAVR